MTTITRLLTYAVPDELYSTATTLGKTSTQLYEGPAEIILWIDDESGVVEEIWSAPDDLTDRDPALNQRVEILRADSDINCMKIGLIYGGLATPKVYEVAVGPSDLPNISLSDPSDIRSVYKIHPVEQDYTADLQFVTLDRDRSDEFIRDERNSRLAASDSKLASDMPESLRTIWLNYRQRLRDLPSEWADTPNHLIKFPISPDEHMDTDFDDDEVTVVMIADRTDDDADAIAQLPGGAD
jgi:hypothetical protein|tara:strand:+ start:382 stop:1101 length:720 start_codon:yes stop_codon:yes gene_type:complete